ncbi:MAG: hypothetical protein HGB12_11870, partial [Bacteroidetes bacterium]|nr:hypothetical protein [Bacteroidota bacterium]
VAADTGCAVILGAVELTATCFGSGAVSFTVTATGGLTYQWQEFIISWNNVANAGVYSNVNTAILTITNPPLSMNANKYRCVVSGTCTNTTSDGEATLSVNPIPLVTNAATTTTCSGTGPNISLTSSLPSNFSWTIGTITGGITGASASSGVTINQTLINPSNDTAGSIQYIVTPTSTAGSCVGAAFTITVTVNPTPTVTNTPLAQSICLGGNTTLVTLTSNVSGTTFAWTASATSGVSGFTTSGSGTIPVQTIYTSASTAGTVTYAITPTANGCAGSVTNYVTTVNLFATGGTITYTDASGLNPRSSPPYSGGYTVHAFTSSGTFTPNCSGNVEVLVVAGGGGGAGRHGGGGGAGGLIYNSSFAVTAQAYATTIGAGGNGSVDYATNGSNSVFGSLTAIGGARGRTYGPGDAQATGGSGGGGAGESPDSQSPNLGTSGQGNNGGQASSTYEAGGGGGGAGAAGGNASVKNGGAGGNGLAYSISGTSKYYAGGGGGGASGVSPYGTAGAAGLGGGGRGGDGYTDAGVTAGTPNTGGGGGASRTYSNVPGAGGGSGIVIIRYHN